MLFNCSAFVFAQENEKIIEQKAFQFFNNKQYSEALPLFSQLLSLYPKDERYNLYYAACLIETNQQVENSIKYLQYADSKSNDPLIKYYLGRAYHLTYQFDKAEENYSMFKQLAPSKLIKQFDVDKLIEMCNNGKELIKYISELTVVDNRRIKSENYFYSYDLKEFDGKLIIKPKELKSSIDKKEEPPNTVIFLPNNSNIVYYGSYGNTKANGRDIYRIERLPDGKWGKPENLGSVINTKYDEDYPFLHSDGKTLYFSSKGHNSMGGYDIFKSVYDSSSNSWTKPVNLDFPTNSPYDDYLYIVDKDNFYAYFTSNRETRDNNITVYKIIVDKNPIPREYKDIEEIKNIARLEVSPLAVIKKAEESRKSSKEEEKQQELLANPVVAEKAVLTPYTFKPIAYNPNLTSQEVANNLKADNEKIQKQAQEIKRQANLSYIIAKKNNDKANEKRRLAYEKNEKIKTLKDPVEIEQTKQEVYHLIDEAEEYERQAITAYNLAKKFEAISQEMQKDIAKSQNFISAIEQQGKVDEAIVDAANKNKERLQLSQNKYTSLQKEIEERKNIQKNKENELFTLEEIYNKTTDSLNALDEKIDNLKKQYEETTNTEQKNSINNEISKLNNQYDLLQLKQIEIAEQIEKLKVDIDILNSENAFIRNLAQQVAEDPRKNEELEKEITNKDQLKKEIFEKELSADIAVAETIKQKVVNKQESKLETTKQTNKTKSTEPKLTSQTTTKTKTSAENQTNIQSNTNIPQLQSTTITTPQQNIKPINPLLPTTSDSKSQFTADDFEKEQFKVQYYTNIINEQQQKLEILNKAISKTKDKKEKQLLEQQRDFLLEEIQNNKAALAQSQNKVKEYKNYIANKLDTSISNEELVLQASKYDNKYEINFSLSQKRALNEAEQTVKQTKEIEKQLIDNNKEIKRLQDLINNSSNKSETKQYEDELNQLVIKQNQLYRDYVLQTDKANQQKYNVYNEILLSVRNYDVSNENIKTASILEKEIEAIKEKSANLKKEAAITNDFDKKLNTYKKAATLDMIAIEKQKYAIDLYITGRQMLSQNVNTTNNKTVATNQLSSTPENLQQTKSQKNVQIELSPEENKRINEYQSEIAKADVKFKQGSDIYKEIEEKKQLAANTYSEAKKREILKDIDKKEKQAFQILLEAHNIYEKANQNKYNIYKNQTEKLIQNENIPDENKSIAKQFLKESEFYFEEAQQLRNNSKETTNLEEKISLLNKAKLLEEKSLINQEYAIDALTNTKSETYIATNNLVKVDRLEALDKPVDVDEIVKIKTDRIIANLNLNEQEKSKLDEAISKQQLIKQLNDEAEKYKNKLDLANEIVKYSTDPKEKKKAQKSIPKLEKEYFARIFTAAELTEAVNDNMYSVYESKFPEIRLKDNSTSAQQGKQLEKNANKLYVQAKQLRDKSFMTENPYLAYNYLLQADSLEKLAIEQQEKAFGLYLNLKPLEEEIKEYAQKKQAKKNIDELVIIKTPASVTPLDKATVEKMKQEQEVKEKLLAEKTQIQNPDTSTKTFELKEKQENKSKEITPANEEDDSKIISQTSEKNNFLVQQNSQNNIEGQQMQEKQMKLTNKEADNSIKQNNAEQKNLANEQTEVVQQEKSKTISQTNEKKALEQQNEFQQKNTEMPNEGIKSLKDKNTSEQPKANEIKNENEQPVAQLSTITKPTEINKEIVSTKAEAIIPKNVTTPMGFAYMAVSPYSDANPIPINPPLPEGLVFKVQIGAFFKPVKNDVFKGLSPLTAEKLEESKYYRYFVGLFYSEDAAIMVRDYIRPMGYPDAFVVAFYNGKRITLFEARQLIKQSLSKEYQQLVQEEQKKIKTVTSVPPTTMQIAKTPETAEITTKPTIGTAVSQIKDLFYTVQIGVYKNPVSHDVLKNLTPLYEDHAYGFIRYLVGKFNDRRKAEEEKNKIVALGITDAFVSAYYNGKKITLNEAASIEAMNPNAIIKTSESVNYTTQPTENKNKEILATNVDINNLYYRVQIGAFKEKVPFDIAAKFIQISSQYAIDQEVDANGTTIYYAGKFKSYEQAVNCKNDIVKQGFNDAFIIATDGKQRISVNQARQLLKQ